ncbi:hypothetical protein HJB89_25385 [Rhizobium sp. NZLR8]|uniref:hypothetical protein n=1 Tax=Rhizobium sp. NZLR8 TaxID=2731104 RepID=UPI001C82F0A0|nr:hypothetical protein [Rhizobium sp. NZLR8]MBX5160421.1 hypothetical protein [Rhizobium sp. NZLR8]
MSIFEITIGHSAPPPSLLAAIFPGLVVALVGGIVVWGLTWLKEVTMAKRNRHTEAEVLAFSLASELDRLVSACYEVVNDPQEEDRETGYWEPTVDTPKLTWGSDLKWSSFPRSLQYRIRALPNKIDAAVKSCAAEGEYGDGPPDFSDYFREREFRFSWIGLEASALRFELSKNYGVEYLDRGSWDPDDSFKEKIAKIEKQKEELAKARKNHPFFQQKVPIEELEKRRSELGAALEVAKAKANTTW